MTRLPIMAHMIPFFPDLDGSYRVARALADGGARYLEIQFPYSDPTADGPTIQGAGARALAQGFTVRAGWEFVAALRAGGGGGAAGAGRTGGTAGAQSVEGAAPGAPIPPIFVMSYAGLVYAYGVDHFVARAAELGLQGVIVPDLPLDSDEGLLEAGARHGVHIVPVIALGAAPHRMALVHAAETQYVYASLRRGITGTHTEIGAENIAFLEALGARGAKVLAGFGIDSPGQVEAVTAHAHAAVVGSAFVRAVNEHSDPYPAVRALTEHLVTPR